MFKRIWKRTDAVIPFIDAIDASSFWPTTFVFTQGELTSIDLMSLVSLNTRANTSTLGVSPRVQENLFDAGP